MPAPVTPTVTPLQFRDGTSVVPRDDASEVVIASASDDRVRLQLRRGGARFDVTPNPDRRFQIEAGLVTVEVLGTEFDCTRDGDQVHVEVFRGRVSVSWGADSVTLSAGDSGVFPPTEAAPAPADVEPPARPRAKQEAEWRRLARRGERDKAYDAMKRGRVANRAEELMLAADVARKAGHPEAALPYLRRVVDEHGKDSRAPLAAFTMGRIELRRHNYRAAAKHFVTVRELGSKSLAEHALAREVEAWAGAKEPGKAKNRAAEYLRRFPNGPRADQVRRHVPEEP
ncbi:MAG: FecR domain-containing protein [Myxococcota bacterium]